MKTLVKFSVVLLAIIAFASCRKTEFNDATPVTTQNTDVSKSYHDGNFDEWGGEIFTDKDKCKKCHSTPKSMGIEDLGIDWQAPYMSDNRYTTIEEVVNNFDFTNNVHLSASVRYATNPTISETEKQDLINYLLGLASEASKGK